MYIDIHIRVIYTHSCMYITWRLRGKKREKMCILIYVCIYTQYGIEVCVEGGGY